MSVVTVDVRMLDASGIGTYLRNLLPIMVEARQDLCFRLLGDVEAVERHSWGKGANVAPVAVQAPIYSFSEQVALLRSSPKGGVFWAPHYNIPLFTQSRLVVTVHDVLHLAMPQVVGALYKRLYARAMFAALRKRATAVICDSEFTADELVKFTSMSRRKLHVIPLAVHRAWFDVKPTHSPHMRPYLLYVGNVKPHKNLRVLIDAFASLLDELPHDLVVVGKKEGFITGDPAVMHRALALGNRVHFTGAVGEGLLQQYFVHAETLVIPSLYEGFGLPPLEGMACGCPVVVSCAGSLPETCGDAALYFDPYDPRSLADQIRRIIRDVRLRDEMQERGRAHAASFSWSQSASATQQVLDDALLE